MRSHPQLDRFEQNLARLRVEFERYFNGALDLPPAELQFDLKADLKHLRNTVKSSANRFRLNSLEARFNAYNEMFNRRVRDIEEGRTVRRGTLEPSQRYDVSDGILVSGRIDDSAAAALYQGLYSGSSKSNKIDLDKFRGYLNQQAGMIRQKTGCNQVQFRLAQEGGKLKLKAKPIRTKSS